MTDEVPLLMRPRVESWPGLQDRYQRRSCRALARSSGRTNVNSLPKLQKIVVNMGVGKALQDKNRMEQAAEQLDADHRAEAQITKARMAVSGFRLRENNEIGCRVTLRGRRMYEFLDRLITSPCRVSATSAASTRRASTATATTAWA